MDQTELLPHRDNPIDGVHGLGNIPDFLRKGAEPQYKSQISTILNTARDIHLQRNSAYGESYKRYGALLIALFPEGGVPPIRTAKEADRLSALMNCLGKLHRYAHNFEAGGHTDSAMDLINYAAMLVEATK